MHPPEVQTALAEAGRRHWRRNVVFSVVLLFVWASGTDPASSSALADYSASRLTSDQARLPLWREAA